MTEILYNNDNLDDKLVIDNEPCEKLRETQVKSRKKYTCDYCNYYTFRKNDYAKHNETNKHKLKKKQGGEYICDLCNSKYVYKSGLYRHKKKCKGIEKDKCIWTEEDGGENNGGMDTLHSIVKTLVIENKELNKKITTISNRPQIVNHLHKNKYVNVIQFLNKDCNNALNLSDFVNAIPLSFDDLQYIEKNGYIQGVQNSFIKQLSTTEQKNRPIHCTDPKRKQFYIKENNTWDKDLENEQLLDALKTYNMNQLKLFDEWSEKNKDWSKNDDIHNMLNQLLFEITQLYSDDKEKIMKKIIHEISKVTTLDMS